MRADYIQEYKTAVDHGNKIKNNVIQSRIRRATPSLPSEFRGGQLAMIQEGDEEGDLEDVPPNVIVKDKKDLINTAQVETYVEVKI